MARKPPITYEIFKTKGVIMTCPYCDGNNIKRAGSQSNKKRWYCKDCKKIPGQKYYFTQTADIEILTENVKLAKAKQKFQDSNRIERKSFREHARLDNALEEYNKELIKVLNENKLSKFTLKHKVSNTKAAGIIHFTDAHFNELVNLTINKYDFTIASQRCKKFVEETKKVFNTYGIVNVLFASTGDIMNSDRRLDELLNMATNRSKATFLAVYLLEQMILDLNKDFNVTVASVIGNESRCTENPVYTDNIATDNYDYTVHQFLKYVFKNSSGIKFVENENPFELVIDVAGYNILLVHGHQKGFGSLDKAVAKIIRKYSDRGICINHVLCGHIHESHIADLYSRSSSLVGANAYSERDLMLTSRASQNIHILTKDSFHSMKIDLQNTPDPGYDIIHQLESYNAKSADKARPRTNIMQVVI